MTWLFEMVLMASPWQAPPTPPEPFEPRVLQMCRDDGASSPALATTPATMPPRTTPHGETVRPPTIRRGVSPMALVLGGAAVFATGTGLRLPSAIYMEVTPDADPWREPAARAAYTSYTHETRELALGTVGTIFQAVGVGLIRRGLQGR
jgi:hypothetical protein